MLDFDQGDLVALGEEAGFCEIGLELYLSVRELEPIWWVTWLNVKPNPLAPSLSEELEGTITPEERMEFEAHFRPLVEAGKGRHKEAVVYLTATKPRLIQRIKQLEVLSHS
jgi:hypothetical protein